MTFSKKILFILSNIFEIEHGVSLKYIQFIEYLSTKPEIEIILFCPSTTFPLSLKEKKNIKWISVKGFSIPFYHGIRVPILSSSLLKKEIQTGKEVILFHGEFFWLYEKLKRIQKKYKEIQIYANMHTDYEYYLKNIYHFSLFGISPFKNHLYYYLQHQYFKGMVVTGENLKTEYLKNTPYVFNANEVNLSIFENHKYDDYSENSVTHIFYCGRIAKEKNVYEMIPYFIELEKRTALEIHIIGTGPELENFQNDILHSGIKSTVHYYGAMKQKDIYDKYMKTENRLFLFLSDSETFGKSPMEAAACGIPLFLKKNQHHQTLYKNSMVYFVENPSDFIKNWEDFIAKSKEEKISFLEYTRYDIQKYNQKKIFEDWYQFLIHSEYQWKTFLNYFDIFTFHSVAKLVQCSGTIMGNE